MYIKTQNGEILDYLYGQKRYQERKMSEVMTYEEFLKDNYGIEIVKKSENLEELADMYIILAIRGQKQVRAVAVDFKKAKETYDNIIAEAKQYPNGNELDVNLFAYTFAVDNRHRLKVNLVARLFSADGKLVLL